jgi:hypothetical protein
MVDVARRRLVSLRLPMLLASALVVPFMTLEWVTRRGLGEAFPWTLFTFMSVHALLIALLVTPALQRLRVAPRLRALSPPHWLGLLLCAGLLLVYVGVVRDQWPCFVGVPVCD